MQHIRLLAQEKTPSNASPATPVDHYMDDWESVIQSNHLKVWRKEVPDSYLYEYKGKK